MITGKADQYRGEFSLTLIDSMDMLAVLINLLSLNTPESF
jgi:hypothetical protein